MDFLTSFRLMSITSTIFLKMFILICVSLWLVNECHCLFFVPFHRLSKVLKDVKTPFWRVQLEVEKAWRCFVLVWLGRLQNMVGVELIHVSNIVSTVEPPLTDTSCGEALLVSGHLVMFSATYKHYIFNLL